jgi:hypothetical protein
MRGAASAGPVPSRACTYRCCCSANRCAATLSGLFARAGKKVGHVVDERLFDRVIGAR